MSHTPEPWILFEVGDRFKHQCPASSDRTSILTTATEDDVQWGAVYSDEDARRIVACVNACAGMRNDELEGGLLLAVMSSNIERLEAERKKLRVAIGEAENITIESIKRMRAAHVPCADLTLRAENLLQSIKQIKGD